MERRERLGNGRRCDPKSPLHFGIKPESYSPGFGRQLSLIRPDIRDLFVKEGWEKKELIMCKSKAIATFCNSTLSQENGLRSVSKRLTDQRPFFKTDAFHFLKRKLASAQWRST